HRGGDAGPLAPPDIGTGCERRLARPAPEVLGSDLTSSGGGPRLRCLEFLEQTERIDVGGHDRGLPVDRLPQFHEIRFLCVRLFQREPKQIVLCDRYRRATPAFLADRLELLRW